MFNVLLSMVEPAEAVKNYVMMLVHTYNGFITHENGSLASLNYFAPPKPVEYLGSSVVLNLFIATTITLQRG